MIQFMCSNARCPHHWKSECEKPQPCPNCGRMTYPKLVTIDRIKIRSEIIHRMEELVYYAINARAEMMEQLDDEQLHQLHETVTKLSTRKFPA